MNRFTILVGVSGLLTAVCVSGWSHSQEPEVAPKNEPGLESGIEVQTRGPLHEAYAQPFDVKPAPGPMVPKAPPPPIPEEPPEERPDNANAQWIPGYWAWDEQRQDYMWVSGVYRVPPQNRTFVPGYWNNTPEGWRWVPGFWSNSQQPDVPYTPEPPAPLDSGPQYPAPDDNSTYIPGVWIYRDSRFIWRPGYWAPYQEGRVWVPPTYQWSPNGYLFVDGYWDWPFESRGLIYAPVCFHRPLWEVAGWRYRPSFVVGFNAFFDSCFVGVGGGFYFGNFYDPFFARQGFRPWHQGRGFYDPAFAHHAYRNQRVNPNWHAGIQQTYASRAAGRAPLPPTTFAQQGKMPGGKGTFPVVMPVNQFTGNQVKVVKASPAQIQTQQQVAKQTREIATNRQRIETAQAALGPKSADSRTLRVLSLGQPPSSSGAGLGNRGPEPRTLGKGESGGGLGPVGKGPPTGGPSQPKIVNNSPNGGVKGPGANIASPTPKVINNSPNGGTFGPGTKIVSPTPKINNTPLPQPRVGNPTPAPQIINRNPAPQVVNPAPQIINRAPIPQQQPRIINTAPAPKVTTFPSNPQPRIAPSPAPRISSPPASAPRISSPPPASRMSSPAPRVGGGAPVRRK